MDIKKVYKHNPVTKFNAVEIAENDNDIIEAIERLKLSTKPMKAIVVSDDSIVNTRELLRLSSLSATIINESGTYREYVGIEG